MKVSVIVCAAGKGERAGFNKNKLTALLNGAPALYYTLCAFDEFAISYTGDSFEKIAVCAEGDQETQAICTAMGWQVVIGGATRTESVYNALCAASGDIALIHDGARPFVTQEIIEECIACAKEHGSAICAAPAVDTIAIVEEGVISAVPNRSTLYNIQTPQVFLTEQITAAYGQAIASGQTFTDDSSVYSQYIKPAKICPCGTPQNKKLTYKEDFENFATPFPTLFFDEEQPRVGFGVDVHTFGKQQDYVTLCGCKIACDEGLVAHSDGDVAIHAVMDAILSAAGLKDIGYYFPDSDQKYKGANSLNLLSEVIKLITQNSFKPIGLAIAIQAEKPRLAKHIDQMVANLADACDIPAENISITAGTCEGLGFVGKGLGICAYCTAVLKEIKNG